MFCAEKNLVEFIRSSELPILLNDLEIIANDTNQTIKFENLQPYLDSCHSIF